MAKVADYIEQHREQIVQRYAEEISKLPSAKGLTHYETIDTLPEYLETLVRNSRAGKRGNREQIAQRLEEAHLALRLRLGFTQEEVTGEYALISHLIAGLWERAPAAERPAPDDVQLLIVELQAAMDKAVEVFSGYGSDERQAEKRYLRRLDALATRLAGEVSTGERTRESLQPLLEVVQEAMDAKGAALFLVDNEGRLRLSATVGMAAETAEPVALERPSFLKQIVDADTPVYLPDAANQDRQVSEALSRSGLRSLLGLRLYPYGKLLGAVYVGIDHVRLFEPRARRYFQLLVDYFSGMVERTMLIAESQQAKQRFQLLLDSAAEGIYGLDADGRCTFANPACAQLLGYRSSGDLIGRSMHDLIHHTKASGEPYPHEECPLLKAARCGQRYDAEGEMLWRADGTFLFSDQRAAPVYQDGQVVGAVITFSDVTARLKSESEREALLRQTQRAVAVREEIVRIVSHDLRNPLGAIMTSAGLLMRNVPSDEPGRRVRKNISLIQRSAERMHRLIDDLMDFGSIEAGTLAVKRRPDDPVAIVHEAYAAIRESADERGILLREAVPEQLPEIICDRDRVLQILENLLSNAINVSAAGSIITLGAQVETDAVRFAVADAGSGIAADELPHLFDRYWRSQRADYRGTGLGLAIADGLVRAHGGRIWAESTLGEGSTFYFTIPLARA